MRQRLNFPGIARSLTMGGTADGTLEYIDGMRPVAEGWEATSDNDVMVVNSNGFYNPFIHTVNNTVVYCGYDFQTGDLQYWINNNAPRSIYVGSELDVVIKSIGSMLVLMTRQGNSNAKMKYFEYNVTTGLYADVTLDETENVEFEFQGATSTVAKDMGFQKTGDDFSSIKAGIDKVMEDWAANGQVNGWMFVSTAFVLYDGSYFRPSIPQLIYFGTGHQDSKPTTTSQPDFNAVTDDVTLTSLLAVNGIDFTVRNLKPATIQIKVKDLSTLTTIASISKIVGIAIFASPVLARTWDYGLEKGYTVLDKGYILSDGTYYGHRTDNTTTTKNNPSAATEYLTYDQLAHKQIQNLWFAGSKEVSEWYRWIGLFKVGVMAVGDITESFKDIPKTNHNSITQQEMFPVDLARHTLSGKTSFVYNKRLIMGNISTKLYGEGLKTENVLNMVPPVSSDYQVYCVFKVKTSDQLLSINTVPCNVIVVTGTIYLTTEYRIVYPDSRAYQMDMIIYDSLLNQYKKVRSFVLTPSETSNISYYVTKIDTLESFESLSSYTTVDEDTTYNPTLVDPDRVQASQVGNPYLFPARYSYNVGTTKIRAIASTTEPTSQGQFGQYPVIVFTGDGVWALELGSGEVFVSNIVPLTADVAIDDNVVSNSTSIFFKTAHGVFALSGRQSVNLSVPLVADCDTSLDGNTQLSSVYSGLDISSPDRTSFLDFLHSGQTGLAIDPKTQELLVYNRYKDFTYVFGLDSKAWYVKNRGYISLINDHYRLLSIANTSPSIITEIDQQKSNTSFKKFMVETRPLFVTKGLFGINSLKVEAFTKGATGNTLIVAIMATNGDGSKWMMIAGKKIMLGTGERVSEVVFGHIPGKWRAFKVVIVGTWMVEAKLLGMEVDISEPYNNKLR